MQSRNLMLGAILAAGMFLVAPYTAAQQTSSQTSSDKRTRTSRWGDSASRERRAALERKFREESDQLVRDRLKLNETQMAKLRTVNQRIDTRRRTIFREGWEIRESIRKELSRGNEASQERVRQLLDRTSQNRRDMLNLFDDEQKELARFLTPVQRAQYQSIQERLIMRIQRMRSDQRRSRSPRGTPSKRESSKGDPQAPKG